MKAVQGVFVGIIYAGVALVVMKLGFDGFKLNYAGVSAQTFRIVEVYHEAKSLDGQVISIAVDSSIYLTNLEHGTNVYQFTPLDSSLRDIRVLYESSSQVYDTVFGVFQTLESEYPELILESGDFSNMYIIKHTPEPRKWYWNLMLILVPLLFLRAFVQAMSRMLKGVKYDHS
ncbi:MAG: hypothetical protein ACPGTP_03185 [Bacteroidia bacterium]